MFNFNFGKKRLDKKQLIIISAILSAIVATLSQCTGAPQEALWDLLDEVQREFFPQTIINDVLLQDPNLVKRRVERDVDRAIREYEDLTRGLDPPKIPLPRFIEKAPDGSKAQSLLGGEMRLCASWVPDCIDTSTSGTEGLTEQSESGIINELVRDKPPTEPGKFKF